MALDSYLDLRQLHPARRDRGRVGDRPRRRAGLRDERRIGNRLRADLLAVCRDRHRRRRPRRSGVPEAAGTLALGRGTGRRHPAEEIEYPVRTQRLARPVRGPGDRGDGRAPAAGTARAQPRRKAGSIRLAARPAAAAPRPAQGLGEADGRALSSAPHTSQDDHPQGPRPGEGVAGGDLPEHAWPG